jgi:hypothetical protein
MMAIDMRRITGFRRTERRSRSVIKNAKVFTQMRFIVSGRLQERVIRWVGTDRYRSPTPRKVLTSRAGLSFPV